MWYSMRRSPALVVMKKRILEMTKNDVEKMRELAELAHAGAVRKDGVTPYIEHPRAVVAMLESWGITNPVSLAVAWGHDVLEEVAESAREGMRQEIRAAGGEVVLRGIEWLTFYPSAAACGEKALKVQEKAAYIAKIGAEAPQEIVIVKLADRLCNTRDFLKLGDAAKAREYLHKGAPLFERALDSELAEKVAAEKACVLEALEPQKGDTTEEIMEVVFVVDRSGSMSDLVKSTIDGYNEMLKSQRQGKGIVKITTVLFDHESTVLTLHEDIAKVHKLTSKTYQPRGSTALLDAIGNAIRDMDDAQDSFKRMNQAASKILFVIITDGYENSSRQYSIDKIRKLVQEKREKCGWEFVFLGANMDAIQAATQFGMSGDYAADFGANKEGVKDVFGGADRIMCCMRMSSSVGEMKESLLRETRALREKHSAKKRKL